MRFSSSLTRYIASVIAASAVAFSGQSFAGAFQLWEQDAGGTGDYHAGAAAEADTAATEFYNPAGITRIKHQQVSFGAALISVGVNFTGTATPIPALPFLAFPVTSAAGDTATVVPNMHYVMPISDKWAVAFGVTTPFGLETHYDNVFPVNALATKTELATINLNPSVAYAVNKYLSVGLGFDELYGQAVYNSTPLIGCPIQSKLDGWEPGYNAGLLISVSPATRIGLSYRSEIKVSAEGTSGSNGIFGNAVSGANTAAVFPLPATTILSLYHDVNSRLTLMGSAFYTQWDVFKDLTIRNLATPVGVSTIVINENYRNTWNLSLGGKFKITNHVSLDAGFGHDETPTQIGYRDIRLPDNNRYAGSLGVDVQPSAGFKMSMGWTHFFVPTTPINNSNSDDSAQTTPGAEPAIGMGNSTGDINVYGLQFTFNI